ncbi:Holliday junction ATP-dependent DNA helicase RuvA [Bienertia sinuspersici]
MSLACLVCHGVESPSHSFRSYSVSSSDNDGRCSAMANCLSSKLSIPPPRGNSVIASSKVTPQPDMSNLADISGTPRLIRSRAVRRDQVRNWNFEEIELEA